MCVRTDNNLFTFFTINQFCTRNMQSIWYTAYLFLFFSIASVKLKQTQFVVCFALSVFFRFFLFSAHLCIIESLLYSRMLESLARCLTELYASDFYWIFFSFRLSLIFYLCYQFPAFLKRCFRPMKILLLRYSQNKYQLYNCLYKLNLMREKLSYQIINISAANQAVFCDH